MIKPDRHIYKLTQDRHKELAQWLKNRLSNRLMTIRFGELVNNALLKWSEESIEQMEKMNA